MSRSIKLFAIAVIVVVAAVAPAIPLQVGDDHPALANYSIDNVPPDYHGPWLNIDTYNGKGIVVVHWKRS